MIKFKFLSEPDDLNRLNDLDSLFDLRKAKNGSALDTEWFSWKPLFVELIIKNPVFHDIWHPLFQRLWRPAFGTCMMYKSQKSNAHCS